MSSLSFSFPPPRSLSFSFSPPRSALPPAMPAIGLPLPEQHVFEPQFTRNAGSKSGLLKGLSLNSPQQVADIRAPHLKLLMRRKELTPTRIIHTRVDNYGRESFSKMAIKYKIENKISTKRNVSIIAYRDTMSDIELKYCIRHSLPGVGHAELLALDALPPHIQDNKNLIAVIYSEREPCSSGTNCSSKLKAVVPFVKVIFSSYYSSEKQTRRAEENNFSILQRKNGIKARPNRPAQKKEVVVAH